MAMGPHYVPKILSLTLAYTKNGDQQFWKEKFHAANEEAQHALMNDPVFFLGGGEYFVFFCCVLIMVSKSLSFQSVPKCVPQDVPNSAWVLANMVCSKFNPLYIN